MRMTIKRPRLSPAQKLRQQREVWQRFYRESADYALGAVAMVSSVEFKNARIEGAHGTISAVLGAGYSAQFRLVLSRPEEHRDALFDAGLLCSIDDEIPWSFDWPATDLNKTKAALDIICPAHYDWPPKPEVPW